MSSSVSLPIFSKTIFMTGSAILAAPDSSITASYVTRLPSLSGLGTTVMVSVEVAVSLRPTSTMVSSVSCSSV